MSGRLAQLQETTMYTELCTNNMLTEVEIILLQPLPRSAKKRRRLLTTAIVLTGTLLGVGTASAEPSVEDISMAYAAFSVCPDTPLLAQYASIGKIWLQGEAGMGDHTVKMAMDPYFIRYVVSLTNLKSTEEFCSSLAAQVGSVTPTTSNFATMPHLNWPLPLVTATASPAPVSEPAPAPAPEVAPTTPGTPAEPETATTTEMIKSFDPKDYKTVDPDDIHVSPHKFLGKPVQVVNTNCFYRDINEYSCSSNGDMSVTVFSSGITPADAKDKLEADCGALKKVHTPACRRTIRFVPTNIDTDNPVPTVTRTVVEVASIEIVPASAAAPRKRKH